MVTVDVTEENFTNLVQNNRVVLLDFWAAWCQPCVKFSPISERISAEFPQVVFGKVNTDDQQRMAGAFGITSIPTVAAIKDGKVVHLQPGGITSKDLRALVAAILSSEAAIVSSEAAIVSSEAGDPSAVPATAESTGK